MDRADFIFRPAAETDIDQLSPMILDCLKGPNGKTNYEVMFNITPQEVRAMISSILAQAIPDHEFHFANYMVAEMEGEIVSICCGWEERNQSPGSEIKRSNLIASFMGLEKWQSSYPLIEEFAYLNIPRIPGNLYLENAMTKKHFRRSNIAYRLVYELIKARKSQFPHLTKIHSHVYLSNKVMYDMFIRFKYTVDQKKDLPAQSSLNQLFPVEGIAQVSIPIENYMRAFEEKFGN